MVDRTFGKTFGKWFSKNSRQRFRGDEEGLVDVATPCSAGKRQEDPFAMLADILSLEESNQWPQT